MPSNEFSVPSRFSKKGKSEFHMSVMIFEILQEMMRGIANAGIEAETTLKPRYIINYYSKLKQLYLTFSMILNHDEKRQYRAEFKYLTRYIDFVSRDISKPYSVVRYLNILQEDLYSSIQKRNIFLYMTYEKSPLKQLENKFGINTIKL